MTQIEQFYADLIREDMPHLRSSPMRARDANFALRLIGFVEYEQGIEPFTVNLFESRLKEMMLHVHGFFRDYAMARGVSCEAHINRNVEQERDGVKAESSSHPFDRATFFRFEVCCVGNCEAANEQTLSDDEVHQIEGVAGDALIRGVV